MRKLSILGLALTALLLPAAAAAQFTVGARLGYAVVGGDAVKDGKMSGLVTGAIPIQLDLGYAVTPALSVGAYLGYGFGMLNSNVSDLCDLANADCSVRVLRVGLQGAFAFDTVSPSLVPWAGLNAGYERGKFEVSQGGQTGTETFTGWEFLGLQGGVDFKATPQFRAGPFLSFSFARYGHRELDPDPDNVTGDITDKGTHTYFTFGVRGQFGL